MASPTIVPPPSAFIPDCERLDIASVKKICKGNQVMIYGSSHCNYGDVFRILDKMKREDKRPPFDKVFNWVVARKGTRVQARKTYEGRDIGLIDYQHSHHHPQVTSRPCKTAITDLVLENYKRIEEGRAVIPLLFCNDIDGNPAPLTMEHIAKRSSHSITIKELRRAYKLCTHENPKVRRAAEETLKFVKMKYMGADTYSMEQIAAPWADASNAAKLWDARKTASRSKPKEQSVNWRSQLDAHIAAYEKERVPLIQPPILLSAITTALPVAAVSLAVQKATDAYETYKSERSITRIGDDR